MTEPVTTFTREQVETLFDGITPWHDKCALQSHHAQISAAVSLKRIADALTALGGPLNAYGETIGECIQGQHERGLRGIPNP